MWDKTVAWAEEFLESNAVYWYLLGLFLISMAIFLWERIVRAVYNKRFCAHGNGEAALEAVLYWNNLYRETNDASSGPSIQMGKRCSFSPWKNRIVLTQRVQNGDSITSVAIAAHEAIHAVQYREHPIWMKVRYVVNFLLRLMQDFSLVVLLVGFLIDDRDVFSVGVGIITAYALYCIVTLPMEIEASVHAFRILRDREFLREEEELGMGLVLSTMSLTYFSALAYLILSAPLRLAERMNDMEGGSGDFRRIR